MTKKTTLLDGLVAWYQWNKNSRFVGVYRSTAALQYPELDPGLIDGVDEYRLYNRVLTPTEIAEVYNNGQTD
jgi:hypothetical protein